MGDASASTDTHAHPMRWRRLLSLICALLCMAGSKPFHRSTAWALHCLMEMAAAHNGRFLLDPARDTTVNAVYIIFSPFKKVIYFGESLSRGREQQHWITSRAITGDSQRVHRVMHHNDPSAFALLSFDFPPIVDCLALEYLLIRRFNGMGRYIVLHVPA